jgi:hypothetical protein
LPKTVCALRRGLAGAKGSDERAADEPQKRHESNPNWSGELLKMIFRERNAFAPI